MSQNPPERFCRLKEVAALLGLPYWRLQRAVKDNRLPSYTLPGSSRCRLVLPSEIAAAIMLPRGGGAPSEGWPDYDEDMDGRGPPFDDDDE
jgi:hypothetical protein